MTISAQENPRPRVGIGVMILKDGKVLLGKRKGAHGEGDWAFPGGHLEWMESIEECARRETMEEAGIEIENLRFQMVANVKAWKPKHYVHINILADWKSGEPEIREPDKCDGWAWYAMDELPSPLFPTCVTAFESFKSGRVYFDE